MGLNELPLDAGRFDDMKFNHRYPNRNYVTLSCINERKISRVGYPIIGEVAEMTGEKYLCMDYGIGDSNKISIVVPIMFNLTEDAPCATIQVRMNLRNPNEPTFSIHVHIPLDIGTGRRKYQCVNEYGIYEMIFASKKQEAKTFRKWVTHEVLPSIRKNGG